MSFRHQRFSGKAHSEKYWKSLIKILLRDDFLKEEAFTGGFGSTLRLSAKGFSHLRNGAHSSNPLPLPLKLTSELLEAVKEETGLKKPSSSSSSSSCVAKIDILPPDDAADECVKADSSSSGGTQLKDDEKEKELVDKLYQV